MGDARASYVHRAIVAHIRGDARDERYALDQIHLLDQAAAEVGTPTGESK